MSVEDAKYNLIVRNLVDDPNADPTMAAQSLMSDTSKEEMKKIVSERPLKIYWGTAPTGQPNIGYIVPLLKLIDFVDAGCNVKILFADLHSCLDSKKTPWELAKARLEFYEELIKSVLSHLSSDDILKSIEFVRGTDFQLSKEYTLDVYRATTLVTDKEAKKAGSDVVKSSSCKSDGSNSSSKLCELNYPMLQILDEFHLDVDAQFGGVDQRKIFQFANVVHTRMGRPTKFHLMNPMLPGLAKSKTEGKDAIADKMSSSEDGGLNLKIGFLDSKDELKRKIGKAYAVPQSLTDGGLFPLLRRIIFPTLSINRDGAFKVYRDEKYGGNVEFKTVEEVEDAYKSGTLSPVDLKNGIICALDQLITPIREKFSSDKMKELISLAYP